MSFQFRREQNSIREQLAKKWQQHFKTDNVQIRKARIAYQKSFASPLIAIVSTISNSIQELDKILKSRYPNETETSRNNRIKETIKREFKKIDEDYRRAKSAGILGNRENVLKDTLARYPTLRKYIEDEIDFEDQKDVISELQKKKAAAQTQEEKQRYERLLIDYIKQTDYREPSFFFQSDALVTVPAATAKPSTTEPETETKYKKAEAEEVEDDEELEELEELKKERELIASKDEERLKELEREFIKKTKEKKERERKKMEMERGREAMERERKIIEMEREGIKEQKAKHELEELKIRTGLDLINISEQELTLLFDNMIRNSGKQIKSQKEYKKNLEDFIYDIGLINNWPLSDYINRSNISSYTKKFFESLDRLEPVMSIPDVVKDDEEYDEEEFEPQVHAAPAAKSSSQSSSVSEEKPSPKKKRNAPATSTKATKKQVQDDDDDDEAFYEAVTNPSKKSSQQPPTTEPKKQLPKGITKAKK